MGATSRLIKICFMAGSTLRVFQQFSLPIFLQFAPRVCLLVGVRLANQQVFRSTRGRRGALRALPRVHGAGRVSAGDMLRATGALLGYDRQHGEVCASIRSTELSLSAPADGLHNAKRLAADRLRTSCSPKQRVVLFQRSGRGVLVWEM